MVMVMRARAVFVLHVAIDLVAALTFSFKLNCDVRDSVFGKLLADLALDFVGRYICYRVKGGIIKLPVKAPNVNVMHVNNAVYFLHVFLYFGNIYALGCFFEEKIKCRFEIAECIYDYKYSNTDRH